MKIPYFPNFYEDELFYSVLSRFHMHSGYMYFNHSKEVLYQDENIVLSMEFINPFSKDAVEVIEQVMTMDELIINHTMYPFYARFFSKEKKEKVMIGLLHSDSDEKVKGKSQKGIFLRYCPICAMNDRKEKGEAIWYRKHQLPMIKVCSIHGCRLHDSSVSLNRYKRTYFVTAEEIITDLSIEDGTEIELEMAKYFTTILSAKMEDNENIAGFFNKKIYQTRISIYDGIKDFYEGMEINHYIGNTESLKKAMNGNKDNVIPICLLGIYLGIPAEEITGSYETICPLDKQKYRNLKEMDNLYFPEVKRIISDILEDRKRRQKRITGYYIEKELGLKKNSIYFMPKCMELIHESDKKVLDIMY